MTAIDLRCPHCDRPTSEMSWGPEGTLHEDYWVCPCGGGGTADQLMEYAEPLDVCYHPAHCGATPSNPCTALRRISPKETTT